MFFYAWKTNQRNEQKITQPKIKKKLAAFLVGQFLDSAIKFYTSDLKFTFNYIFRFLVSLNFSLDSRSGMSEPPQETSPTGVDNLHFREFTEQFFVKVPIIL